MKIDRVNLSTYNNSIQFNIHKHAEYMKMRDTLENLLKTKSKVTVTFTKRDGSSREMVCTQNPSLIPSDQMPSGGAKSVNRNTIAVYDLENDGWRQIRYDSVLHAE